MKNQINVVIDSVMRIPLHQLSSGCLMELKQKFTHSNPKYHALKAMGFWPGDEPKTIETYKIDEGFLLVPRAMIDQVRSVIEEHSGTIKKVFDRSILFDSYRRFETTLEPYDHQFSAIDKIIKNKNCIIRGPCGSGKTAVLLAAIAEIGQPTLVIVPSKLLLEQWIECIEKWFGYTPGIISGAKSTIKEITIGMQQTIWRRTSADWKNKFGCIAGDEVHRWAAKTFITTIEMFPARYRFGASADERRKDGKEFLIYENFGPCVHKIEKAELIKNSKLMELNVNLIPTGYQDDFAIEEMTAGLITDYTMLIYHLVENDKRNKLICETVESVLLVDKQNRILILTERVEHCFTLQSMFEEKQIESGLMIGGPENRDETNKTVNGLRSGKVRIGIGTTVAEEGLDIPQLTHVFVTCPAYKNTKRLEQMAGRAARVYPGKCSANVFIFWDEKMFPTPKKDDELHSDYDKRLKFFMKSFNKIGKLQQIT